MLPPEDIRSLLSLAASLPGRPFGMKDEDWAGSDTVQGGGSNPWSRIPAPQREVLRDAGVSVGDPTLGPDYQPGPWDYSENMQQLDPELARLILQGQMQTPSAPGPEFPPGYAPSGPYPPGHEAPVPETPSSQGSGFWDWSGNWLSDINQFNPVEWADTAMQKGAQPQMGPAGGASTLGGLTLLDLIPYLAPAL